MLNHVVVPGFVAWPSHGTAVVGGLGTKRERLRNIWSPDTAQYVFFKEVTAVVQGFL